MEVDEDIKQEYESQKKYLKRSVQMLKKNLLKDNEIHKQDNIRIMKDNVELIQEIIQLRSTVNELDRKTKNKKPAQDQLTQSVTNLRSLGVS